MVVVLLVFSLISPGVSQWLSRGNSPRKVWIDWREVNFAKENYRVHLFGGRMRSRSSILNASSYFAPPVAVRSVQRSTRKVDFVPTLRAMIDGKEIYRTKKFDYGDAGESMRIVKIPEVHKKGFVGAGVKISLLDVGVDSAHPAVRHIFRRNGVVATHDFNSGDHLKLYYNQQVVDIPFVNHGFVRYINSFSVASDSGKLVVVYSQTPADSLTNSYLYGKWSLGMTIGYLSDGRIVGWDTMTVDKYGLLKNFPSVGIRNDSVFIVWQEYIDGFKIRFMEIDTLNFLGLPPETISNQVAFNPLLLVTENSVDVFWIDSLKGIIKRSSLNGGLNFLPQMTILERHGTPAGLTGFYENGNFYIAGALGDSTYFLILNEVGDILNSLTFEGIMPSLAKINGDSVRLSLFKNGTVTSYVISNGLVVDSMSVLETPFVYSIYDNGSSIFVADERLISSGTVIDSEFVDFVSGDGDFVVFRKRGDSDITPDPEDPTKHGTKMLSIIGGFLEGSIIGGAPGADYLIAKTEKVVAGPGGSSFESVIEEDFWVEAMEWSIRHGARILSSSLGYRYTRGRDWYGDSLMNGQFAHSSRAASRAADYNLVVVTAMGNDKTRSHFPDPVIGDTSLVAPADARNILSIGGIENEDSVALHCRFGPTSDGRIKPDVVAPYWISWPDTDRNLLIGGTSISTAIVAGGLGAVLEAHPSWDASKIIRYVKETANQIPGLPDSNNISGYGIFDALRLLDREAYEKAPPGDRDRIIAVYPNPVRGERDLHIRFLSFHTGRTVIRIYSIDGALVMKQTAGCSGIGLNEFTVSLPDDISPGTYVILLKTGFSSARSLFSVVK